MDVSSEDKEWNKDGDISSQTRFRIPDSGLPGPRASLKENIFRDPAGPVIMDLIIRALRRQGYEPTSPHPTKTCEATSSCAISDGGLLGFGVLVCEREEGVVNFTFFAARRQRKIRVWMRLEQRTTPAMVQDWQKIRQIVKQEIEQTFGQRPGPQS